MFSLRRCCFVHNSGFRCLIRPPSCFFLILFLLTQLLLPLSLFYLLTSYSSINFILLLLPHCVPYIAVSLLPLTCMSCVLLVSCSSHFSPFFAKNHTHEKNDRHESPCLLCVHCSMFLLFLRQKDSFWGVGAGELPLLMGGLFCIGRGCDLILVWLFFWF